MPRETAFPLKSIQANTRFREIRLDGFRYEFVKAYLYSLFIGKMRNPDLQVVRLLARDSEKGNRLKPAVVADAEGSNNISVVDQSIEATVVWGGNRYEVVLFCFKEMGDRMIFIFEALGLDPEAKRPESLINLIVKESVANSCYRNQYLSVKPMDERYQLSVDVEIVQIEPTTLNDVFVADASRDSLQLFVDCIKHFSTIGQPQRYLLSGKPGTGKTKIIRAIANEAAGKATFIFTNGSDDRIESVFTLAENFSPVVVCIDDVDMLIGNRDRESNRQILGNFLQRLDGFIGSGVFVLATTNDKRFVDLAASRPGRFDMVIDLNQIDAKHYGNLIRSKTSDENILSLFDETVLNVLEARKVTGAFIAALVKHLDIVKKIGNREIDAEYLHEIIDRMNLGFYKEPSQVDEKIGFTN